jgi:hypothetical protein
MNNNTEREVSTARDDAAKNRNICDTCERPYIVNASYDKHECNPLVQEAIEWLRDEKWEEGDTPEETDMNLQLLLHSEIPEWLADFALAHANERAERLEAELEAAERVAFRAGLLACREYMARFIEPQNALYAASIRSNWWPSLGDDPGPPRQYKWSELTEGEYGTEGFKCVESESEIPINLRACVKAWEFLETRIAALKEKNDERNA